MGQASSPAFALNKPRLTIGRSPANDLVLEDRLVSRRHAQIRRKDGIAILDDLGSRNGTYINGKRITNAFPIRPGDVIRVGRTELVLGSRHIPY